MTGPPVVLRRRLAFALRDLRERTGLTIDDISRLTDIRKSSLSRFENAQAAPRVNDLRALLDALGASEAERSQLLELAREAARRGWWPSISGGISVPEWFKSYIGLESVAVELLIFDQFVPGLFQTRDYAKAVIATGRPDLAEAAGLADLRTTRQELLAERAPVIRAVLDESCLHRHVGDKAVMRGQLRRLTQLGSARNVTLQILPFARGVHSAAVGSGFLVMGFQEDPPVVYLEGYDMGHYLEGDTEVDRFRLVYDRLAKAALSARESVKVLANLADTYE